MSETNAIIETAKATVKKKKRKTPLFIVTGEKPHQIKDEWLAKIANEYGFTKFEHVARFGAFRCYKGPKHVEWIDYKELAVENDDMRFHLPCKRARRYSVIGKRLFKTMRQA